MLVKLDGQCRLVIPKGICRKFGWKEGQYINISDTDDKVELRTAGCRFCNSPTEERFLEIRVCKECKELIKQGY